MLRRATERRELPVYDLPPNVFDCLDELGSPEHVYIIGGGEKGADAFKLIPEDAYTIAANSTLKAGANPDYYPRPWTIWSAFDVNGPYAKDNYWTHPVPQETKILMGKTLAAHYGNPKTKKSKATYYFEHSHSLRPGRRAIVDRYLLGGATIIGCNLQLAWFIGAYKFTFVAVDMSGQYHWNGTRASKRTGRWPQANRLEYLIRNLKQRGAIFNTLTPTALKGVPVVKPGKERE